MIFPYLHNFVSNFPKKREIVLHFNATTALDDDLRKWVIIITLLILEITYGKFIRSFPINHMVEILNRHHLSVRWVFVAVTFDLTRQSYFERMCSGTHALHLEIIVMLNFPARGLYLQVSSKLKTSVVCEEGNGNGKEKKTIINHSSNLI